ncbi:MAG TPA: hypothetical protein DDZ68_03135 [Parvularcula sp.]|nr:hypothetical protein [Parvularcula sp.]HBS30283.1 hypothetical protein [Parvularcula sp.]HBS36713.1 hypothetical protein [Parvularcula sp.]
MKRARRQGNSRCATEYFGDARKNRMSAGEHQSYGAERKSRLTGFPKPGAPTNKRRLRAFPMTRLKL